MLKTSATTRTFLLCAIGLLCVLPLVVAGQQQWFSVESVVGIYEGLVNYFKGVGIWCYYNFWVFRTVPQRVLGGFCLFLILGGITGLDGGQNPKLTKVLPTDASETKNPRVYLDIEIGGKKAGRITAELFANVHPRTAENFRALCTGEKGTSSSGASLHYQGSIFHRIIPGFMCQAGDFTNHNGTGGESIYGAKFEDEWYVEENYLYISHDQKGILSMANSGKNTNGSQFFITTGPAIHLDCKHVVFGLVVDGMDVLDKVEKVGTPGGTPKQKVVIVSCGEVKTKES